VQGSNEQNNNEEDVMPTKSSAMALRATAAGAVLVMTMLSAGAAELTILTGQGVVSAVRELAPAFERASGHKVVISYELGLALMNKVNSGAPADVVTHYAAAIDDLIKQGKVLAGGGAPFARAGIGVAVKAGAPKPDIGSADAFKQAMLAARSVAYSRAGASGLYVAKLIERLGIADALAAKTKLVDGVPVAEVIAKGEAEIGLQQINVILPVAGVDYVGPLPRELQDYVVFGAGALAASKAPEAAIALVKFMASPDAAPLIGKSGMEAVGR
jgi:molybdate transport system substrate-binding protein